MASDLITMAPLALPLIKSDMGMSLNTDIDAGLNHEIRCADRLNITMKRKKGMRAFVDKREPVFNGCCGHF